ncbi:hypothetical protein J3D56_000959 [Erwinia persicina]|nr:hypothetical protein [Erwinia persicina]
MKMQQGKEAHRSSAVRGKHYRSRRWLREPPSICGAGPR